MASENRLINQVTSHIQNGISMDIHNVEFPTVHGVPMPQLYLYDVVPSGYNLTAIAQFQSPVASGISFPFNAIPTNNPDGIVITQPAIVNGQSGMILNCESAIAFTLTNGITTLNESTITVYGYDSRNIQVISSLTIPDGQEGGTFQTLSTFSFIYNIVWTWTGDTSPGVPISVGIYNTIGLPVKLTSTQHIVTLWVNGYLISPGEYSTYVTPGNNWRSNIPTTTTSDCRGTITIPDPLTIQQQVTMLYFVMGADTDVNTQLSNKSQSMYTQVGVVNNSSGKPVMPSLTDFDCLGVQYPGNMDFYAIYQKLLAQ